MTWAGDALKSLRKIILIEEKITGLAEDVKFLALRYQDLSERLARIEGGLDQIKAILLRHEQKLNDLTEAIRQRIGFKSGPGSPEPRSS